LNFFNSLNSNSNLENCLSNPYPLNSACAILAKALGYESQEPGIESLRKSLTSSDFKLKDRMLASCLDTGQLRAVPLTRFAKTLFTNGFENPSRENEKVSTDILLATRGLLLARDIIDDKTLASTNDPSGLPRFRVHLFFRNIEGLWGSPVALNNPGTTREIQTNPVSTRLFPRPNY